MSGKCFVISSCIFFIVVCVILTYLSLSWYIVGNPYASAPKDNGEFELILWTGQGKLEVSGSSSYSEELTAELKFPSVVSFIRESTTGNSVKCLAVYLNLTNACQALDDVSKIKTPVPKIAYVTLVDESTCTLQELAGNVQNAGYSVLIYGGSETLAIMKNSKNKVLIPVASLQIDSTLWNADRTYVDIAIVDTDKLRKMESYLRGRPFNS